MSSKILKHSLTVCAMASIAGVTLGMGHLFAPGIEREGSPDHVRAMIELETKPFDSTLFDGLRGWTHANAVSASSIENKVVLIGLVDSGNPQSMLTLSTLARYERQNGDDGLVVLAVHPELGWEALVEKVKDGRVKVQAAQDPGNAFAMAVGSDDAPDLYLIDRAGQLRYADLESRSLSRAVGQLLRETPEQAIANAKLQAQGIELAADDSSAAEPMKIEVSSADYAKANWPAHNTAKLSALDFQGKPLPAALGNEEWLSAPKPIEGKVLVLDFWATWCGPCRAASPKLEELQRENEGKVEVLAIGGASDKEADHKKYVIANKKAYSNLYDKSDTLNNALNVRAIPHTVVMSSDGVIRWQGNPLSSEFKRVVEQVVAADPLLNAKPVTSSSSSSSQSQSPRVGDAGKSVPAQAYAKANWPAHNTGKLYAADHQGKALPVSLGSEDWISDKVQTEGKVVMLDFWATWCGPCKAFSPVADRLQKKYADKLQILAISGQNDPESEVRSHIAQHPVSYAYLHDQKQKVYKSLNVSGIPHVVIMSTDGVIRWQGFPGDTAGFEKVLDQIIAADPMFE